MSRDRSHSDRATIGGPSGAVRARWAHAPTGLVACGDDGLVSVGLDQRVCCWRLDRTAGRLDLVSSAITHVCNPSALVAFPADANAGGAVAVAAPVQRGGR